MARKHGQTTYFIVGEGFVGEETARHGDEVLGAVLGDAPETSTAGEAERAFRFTRMFTDLEAFRPEIEALMRLGRAMDDTPNFKDHLTLPAGFTYFGQFLDHDITFDQTGGLPDTTLTPEEIRQGRSPSLDLDSLYGRGPERETKGLYEADGVHLRVGMTIGLGAPGLEPETRALPNDLPRGGGEQPLEAIIGDPRNDENLAVAQLHLALLKFHNVVVAQLAESGLTGAALFAQARRVVTMHYQWIVLHDFLPRVVEPSILSQVIAEGCKLFQLDPGAEPAMPIEFSVAAYRFGHSMIRDDYSWNRNFPGSTLGQLFEFSGVNGGMAGMGGATLELADRLAALLRLQRRSGGCGDAGAKPDAQHRYRPGPRPERDPGAAGRGPQGAAGGAQPAARAHPGSADGAGRRGADRRAGPE